MFLNLAGLINQINGKIDEVLLAPENTITSRQLGKLLQVDKWNGQSTLVAMKQQFGSLRSYLEMQHIVYSLSFPEDISPDFIIRLRVDDSEEISNGMYSDGSDIDDDDDDDDDYDDDERDNDDVDEDEDEVVDLKISPTTATKKPISKDVTGAVYENSAASKKDNSKSLNNNEYNPEYALIDKMTLEDMKTRISFLGHSDDSIVNMKKEDMRKVLYLRANYEDKYIYFIEIFIRELIQKNVLNETVSRLKEILRAMGQKVSGTKEVLRDRFVDTALFHQRYYHLIKKWRNLKFELDLELDLTRDFENNADDDIKDSLKKKNTSSKPSDLYEKEKLLTTESLTEISRLENKIKNKENKDDVIVITGQAKVDMIMNLLKAQLSCSSDDLTHMYYSYDSTPQSQIEQLTENKNENDYINKKLLEAYVHPASLHSRTDIFGTRELLMNQLTSNFTSTSTSTSTSSTISPLRKPNDIIDDKKIIEVIVNFLKESDDLKVTHSLTD